MLLQILSDFISKFYLHNYYSFNFKFVKMGAGTVLKCKFSCQNLRRINDLQKTIFHVKVDFDAWDSVILCMT